MWIIILLACSIITFEICAQELNSDNQTVAEKPQIYQDADWDHQSLEPEGNIERGRSAAVHGPLNEIYEPPLIYSNQWTPFLMPIHFNLHRDQNLHNSQRDDASDQQFQATLFRRPDFSDVNWTAPLIAYPNPIDTTNDQSSKEETYLHPQLSRSVQNQFSPVPIPIRPPIMYPNAVSINVRRSYTTKIREDQNSSDSIGKDSISEPVTSSYEERYTQVLPSPVFPNMPFIPQPAFPTFPYRNFRNSPDIYPQTTPAIFPRFPYPQSFSRNAILPLNPENRNLPQYDKEVGSEIEERTSSFQERQDFQQPRIADDQSKEDTQPIVPNLVPQSPYSLPFERPAFGIWPPAIIPSVMPNSVAGRMLPLQPPLLSEAPIIPQENNVVPEPVFVDDRLPVQPNPEALSPVAVSSPTDDIQVGTIISEEEKPNASRIPYEFGFDMNDGKGTDQHRKEVSDADGVVRGSYGYRDMFGVYRLVNYIADKDGFRAVVKSNEPGVASSGSADVVVLADRRPPDTVAESILASKQEDIVVPDLIAEGSETETV